MISSDMALYAHQQKLLDQNPPRHLIAWQVGAGKSRMALELAKKNGVMPLIIVPKMLQDKWAREAAIAQVEATIISKEDFRRGHQVITKHSAVIVDEAHLAFGNFKSQTHKCLIAYFKRCDVQFVWLLTGTPYTSSPWSIYSLARLVGVKLDYFNFRKQFFVERYFGRKLIFEPRVGIEDEIAELVRTFGSIVRLDECVDIPEQVIEHETYRMTKEQEAHARKIREKENNPLARFTKYHQIASGVLLGDEFTDNVVIPCEKNERIYSLAETTEKLAVFCRYNAHIDLLNRELTKRGIPVFIIRGDTENRDAVVAEAEASERSVVLINSACSVGYELPSFGVIVFASLSYSYVDMVQSQGRFLRINRPKKNVYIIMTTKNSADEPVLESIKLKRNFSDAIFAQQGIRFLDELV